MFRKRLLFLAVLPFLFTTLIYAQEQKDRPDPENPKPANLEVPADWEVQVDRGRDAEISSDKEKADIWFVNMKPGWHITTGPAAIFYPPANTADGSYTAETVIHLFKPERNREAFGIFFGGKNLDNEDRSYSYFLLRNTGEFLIKKRIGSETKEVKGWSPAPSMNQFTSDTEGESVKNKLTVNVNGDTVEFLINGESVATVPSGQVDTDGVVGLRVNHNLNVHVADLRVDEE